MALTQRVPVIGLGVEVRRFRCFSELVRALRQRHSLSQRAMARALQISSGYVGQWELSISQPSPEMAAKLCRVFGIEDAEYVQRLAYAQRAPAWLRESIIDHDSMSRARGGTLPPAVQRIVDLLLDAPEDKLNRLAERVAGWLEGMADSQTKACAGKDEERDPLSRR